MNKDTLTTVLGAGQAVGTAVITWYATAQQGGAVDWSSPMFYVGLAVAALMAIKAYFTKGIDAAQKVG